MESIKIYTDGACLGNPGPGGWAAIIIHEDGTVRERHGGFRYTTNNRMEITAVVEALSELDVPAHVEVFSDSQYVCNAINKGWLKNWRKRGFARTLNADLWQKLLPHLTRHKVSFTWVRGHAGNPCNERCDRLAGRQARQRNLPHDTGYENILNGAEPGIPRQYQFI